MNSLKQGLSSSLIIVVTVILALTICANESFAACITDNPGLNAVRVACYSGDTTPPAGQVAYSTEERQCYEDTSTCIPQNSIVVNVNNFFLGTNQTIVGEYQIRTYFTHPPCGQILLCQTLKYMYIINQPMAIPVNKMGPPDDAKITECTSGKGSPVWFVNKVNMNLYVTDTPIWYKPAYGHSVELKLSYNSQASINATAPFGNKWTFNYGSYISVGGNNTVTVSMPDGRQDIYMNPNAQGIYLIKPMGVFNTLTQVSNSRYTLTFLDGTVYTYDILVGGSQRASLTKITDAYGQSLTLGYQNNQLSSITDALNNNPTTLAYAPNAVTVTDPFNRTAVFTFDSSHNLISAVDMGGYVTTYTYDTSGNSYLTSVTNPKGTWGFLIEPSDGNASADPYPKVGVGAPMGKSYRITITDPSGHPEEYYYNGGYSWYVSPAAYIPYQDSNNNNMSLAKKTEYWLDRSNVQYGRIGTTTSPEGQYLSYKYDDTSDPSPIPNYIYSNTGAIASVTDSNNHTLTHQYNTNGLITYFWDAKVTTPTATNWTTSYTYYPNNIDVQSVTNGLGSISYIYDASHDVTSVTDRMNVQTTFSYNGYGRLASVVEAANNTALATTTTLNYDPATYTLQTILKNGNLIGSFVHDNIGRLSRATYADGVTINYLYEKLNQIKTITYPDKDANGNYKTEQIVNNTSCPYLVDSTTDRAGLTTNFTYDGQKRLTQKQGPDGTFKYGYDANSNLGSLTDPGSNTTTFVYDLDNRLSNKIYADGTNISYTYDPAGLLSTLTNVRLQTATYGHDANNNLTSITYSDNVTPNVAMTYDAYNRLGTSATVGTVAYSYTYDNDNRLTNIQTTWNDNSTNSVSLGYTANKLTSMTPVGGTQVTYGYNDPLLRLNTITQGSDTFTYNYVGNSSLIANLLRPNGSTVYQYNDPLARLTSVINQSLPNNSIISQYDYTYNNLDLKGTETITNGLPFYNLTLRATTYAPANSLNQITSSTNPARTYNYVDGNMTQAYTPDGYQMALGYDAENRLTSATFTDGQGNTHKTAYAYSGDGLLAIMTKTLNNNPPSYTRYVRAGFLPIQERDGNNNVTREYLWGQNMGGGIGGLLNMRQGGNDYYYLYDGKGNVTSLIATNQTSVAAYSYDPFGVPLMTSLAQGFSTDQPFKFSTKQYDSDTGLYYYGFRFYSPTLGRWINRDPMGENGDSMANMYRAVDSVGKPLLDVNLYRYTGNDPVNYIDPWGMDRVESGIIYSDSGNIIGEYPLDDPHPLLDPVNWLSGFLTGWYKTGYEVVISKNCRIAPFGNRTGNPNGKLPHYHRRGVPGPDGQTPPGQGIGRHRPWDSSQHDGSWRDRF